MATPLTNDYQAQTVLIATDNSAVVAYINKQGGTHLVKICALLWRIMTWCHHYKISLHTRHILGCLNVMADSLSRLTQIQSTEWSLHPQVFKRSESVCFTSHIDPLATCHMVSLYISPVPDQQALKIDSEFKLVGSQSIHLFSHSSPSKSDLEIMLVQLSHKYNSPRLARDALVLDPSRALNRNPILINSVGNTPQAVSQPGVSQQSTISQPSCLASMSEQL